MPKTKIDLVDFEVQYVAPLKQVTPSKPMPKDNAEITAELTNKIETIQSRLNIERRLRIESTINDLVYNCQLTAGEADKAIVRALADETYLAELQSRPQVLPGGAPLNFSSVHTTNDSVRNALGEITKNVGKGGQDSLYNAAERSRRASQVYVESRDRILPVLNAAAANTIDAGLKRVLILNETVRDFATRVLPLRLFSTVFENVPLQGTDQVVVPYYPLQAAASQDFVDSDGTGGTGYQFGQATQTNSKTITVNKRKYQPLDYSSSEFRRQPWFDAARLVKINAEKLAVDILKDILSVIVAANYGPAVKNIPAAGYSSDDIVDLKTIADNLNWPDAGRALIVDSSIGNSLAKDPDYKLALNIGTPSVTQRGTFPNLSGFDYAWMPNFPNNGENLLGVIAYASALGAAFAPVDPAAGVRQQLVAYEIATDTATGISLNYRHWGAAQADRDFEVIESAYGYAPFLANALQRLAAP